MSEHIKGRNSLNKCFELLYKLGKIKFKDGDYFLNENFNKVCLDPYKIKTLLKKRLINDFNDLDNVREEIKKKSFRNKIDWGEIGQNYIYKPNPNCIKILPLDPCLDCSAKNPLYKNKGWLKAIINDHKFNLTTSRLAKLCNQTKEHIKHWIRIKHQINGKQEWGFGRRIKNKYILIRVSRGYKSPEAIKSRGWMREHRYIMELYLSKYPALYSKYLIDGKYLKSEYIIHHKNLDKLDNRLKNLYICSKSKHAQIHNTLLSFVEKLMIDEYIIFKDGVYLLLY